jgi:transposase
MFIDTVPNRGSPPAVLLRESWRDGPRTLKRTLANLSAWPPQKVAMLRRVLRDEPLVAPDALFTVERSVPHGHVEAVWHMVRQLELDTLLGSKRSRERDLVLGLIVERLLAPRSKLATTRLWQTTTLGETLGLTDVDVDEVYGALDWLLARQPAIQQKLAARHLQNDGVALYDVSSSYYEGRTCPLARFGHDRDGHTGRPIIVYGVLTDGEGRPVGVDVYPGNTGDPKTVPDQVTHLRTDFGLARLVLVGDRGLLTEVQIRRLGATPGLGWISALRSPAIRTLVAKGTLQRSLFDEQDLAEITTPDYPHERLIACFNPLLADERRRKREDLLQATERALTRVAAAAARRTKAPLDDATLGLRVGRVINHFKMAKHFQITIAQGRLTWARQTAAIEAEQQLDGIYVIRTSEPADRLTAADAVRQYKSLSQVERAFRCLKGLDLRVRPIFHHTDDHVRAHIFLCCLAYYVEWHLRRAWASLLFADESLPQDRHTRPPVAPAQPSAATREKKITRQTPDGLPVQSFDTLLAALATRCEVTCRLRADPTAPPIRQWTEPTPLQARAFALLRRVQDAAP